MSCCSALMLNPNHTFRIILLRMWLYQNSQRSTLQSNNIFILELMDLQIKRKHILSVGKNYFFRLEVVPYLISSTLGNHRVFLGSFISSQYLESSDHVNEEDDEPSSIRGNSTQRWVDKACGYSSQHDSLPPTHLHKLFFYDSLHAYL
jgi:hypothetical protein